MSLTTRSLGTVSRSGKVRSWTSLWTTLGWVLSSCSAPEAFQGGSATYTEGMWTNQVSVLVGELYTADDIYKKASIHAHSMCSERPSLSTLEILGQAEFTEQKERCSELVTAEREQSFYLEVAAQIQGLAREKIMEAQDGNFNRNLLPAIRALNGSREAIALEYQFGVVLEAMSRRRNQTAVNEAIENLSTRLSHNGELLEQRQAVMEQSPE